MIFSLLDILSSEKYSSHPAALLCDIPMRLGKGFFVDNLKKRYSLSLNEGLIL